MSGSDIKYITIVQPYINQFTVVHTDNNVIVSTNLIGVSVTSPGPQGVGLQGVAGPQGVQGPVGNRGLEGPQGIQGVPGTDSDKNYRYVQDSAASQWTIVHSLNKLPSITVIDSGGTIIEGLVEYIDVNTISITFLGTTSGIATLN